jgi:hypothetical protein
MLDRAKVVQEIRIQARRCRKPHFSDGAYSGRSLIEAWNQGVDSLERELIAALLLQDEHVREQ